MPRLEAWKMPRVVRWVLTKYNILDLIICFSGLIINMTGRLYDIYQYNDKSRKISNAIEAYGGNPSKENMNTCKN